MAQNAPITNNNKAPGTESPVISEKEVLKHLRRRRPARHKVPLIGVTIGERVADLVAAVTGSWTFIIAQTVVLALWIVFNAYNGKPWDPYPFILLNLLLSFQAAYAAPIIMMAQNRQADIDRRKAEMDYDVNLKAELEIELLHQKMDLMREQEIKRLTELVEELLQKNRKEPS
jgi:uncharacterized membrane protein